MKPSSRTIELSLLLFGAALLVLPLECEAQVKEMSIQELTMESTSILYGKCTKMESAWTENNEMIFTTVTIVPEYYLKGNIGNEVSIVVPGGQVGDIVYEVSEMPSFRKGEEVFAFVWKHPSGKNLVTGGYQGKLKIDMDVRTGKKTVSGKQHGKDIPKPDRQEAISADKKTPLPQKNKNRVSLDDFTREVTGYLNER